MRNLANLHQSTWKILKLGLRWDIFIQSRKCISLQFTEELSVMTMKNDAKFKEELTCRFKIDMWNLTNFDPSTQKSQKLNGLLLIGVHNVKKVKKSAEEICFMTMKSDAKFEEKLTCGLENDIRNLANFHQSTWHSQNCDFHCILL